MKDIIHKTINDMKLGYSTLIDMIENAMIYTYSKKYEYRIEYFYEFEKKFIKANIKFMIDNDMQSFSLSEGDLKSEIRYCKICNTKQNAERFDQAMLFLCNQQLKKQTLIDFI